MVSIIKPSKGTNKTSKAMVQTFCILVRAWVPNKDPSLGVGPYQPVGTTYYGKVKFCSRSQWWVVTWVWALTRMHMVHFCTGNKYVLCPLLFLKCGFACEDVGFWSLVFDDLGLKPLGCKYFPFPLTWVVVPFPLLLTAAVEESAELDVCIEVKDTSRGFFWGLFLRCVTESGRLGADVEGTLLPSLGVACNRDKREVPAWPVLLARKLIFFLAGSYIHTS